MGILTFLKNLKYLARYNLKEINAINDKSYHFIEESLPLLLNNIADNIKYELPDTLGLVKRPKIYDFKNTLNSLSKSDASFCRFGDGELILMMGDGIGFQDKNPDLSFRLKEILQRDDDKLLVGINYHYYYADLNIFEDYTKFVYRTYI